MKILKYISLFLMAAFWLIAINQNATAQMSNDELAKSYLKEYFAENIEGLALFLSDDATFEDSADTFIGRDALINGFTRVFSDIDINGYEEHDAYHSGSFYFTKGIVDFSVKAESLGETGDPFNFIIRFAVSLKMENGKVTSHRDYVDSAAFMEQFSEQKTNR